MNKTIIKIFVCFMLFSALIAIILLFINALSIACLLSDTSNIYPNNQRHTLESVSAGLEETPDGFALNDPSVLPEGDWCVLIDENGDVIWEMNKPEDVPDSYTINDIARMSRWFLNDYPVFVQTEDYGLLVLGTPKNSVAKYQLQYSMGWFSSLPERIISIVVVNLILAVFLALILGSSLYRKLNALTAGIASLRMERRVNLKEKGIFREISKNINDTSKSIERKNAALTERDNARSNWIAGISHDIRTPLSVVMGYSEEMASSPRVPEEYRKKAALINTQSVKIKKMIEDLNLISSLEYDMQPSKKRPVRVCPLLRDIISEILNGGLDEKYSIELDFKYEQAVILGDEFLLERAFFNLINNAVAHNPDGCAIKISEYGGNGRIYIKITDNGKGVPEDVIKNIAIMPKSTHGLGLPMAYRIIAVHGGSMDLKNSNGFTILIELPELS